MTFDPLLLPVFVFMGKEFRSFLSSLSNNNFQWWKDDSNPFTKYVFEKSHEIIV